jgi:hypothetical protein
MVRIDWHESLLNVRRVVLGRELPEALTKTIMRLATERSLKVAGEEAIPEFGDLWVCCEPRAGYGEAGKGQIGRVPGAELYLALAQLRHSKSVAPGSLKPLSAPPI